jgi:hypothetical protein
LLSTLSKCAADRKKDWAYASLAIAEGLVDIDILRERVELLPFGPARRRSIQKRLEALV